MGMTATIVIRIIIKIILEKRLLNLALPAARGKKKAFVLLHK